MQRSHFGNTHKGIPVHRFRLESASGVRVDLMEYGASVLSIEAPDRAGCLAPVTLGLDSLDRYLVAATTPGATSGSPEAHADDELARSVWWGEALGDGVRFHYHSPAGEGRRPCAIDCTIEYRLDSRGVLRIETRATSEARAVIDVATSLWFNLAGSGREELAGHVLEIAGRETAECDRDGVATGYLERVDGRAADFRTPRVLGDGAVAGAPAAPRYYLANAGGACAAMLARLRDPESGRSVEITSSRPALRVEFGTHDSTPAWGVLLRPQNLPASDRHAHFPEAWITPDRSIHHTTFYRFGIAP